MMNAWSPGDNTRARRRDADESEVFELMVRLAGIEPTTLGFGGQYSIH